MAAPIPRPVVVVPADQAARQVRTARLDRQLTSRSVDPLYADPQLERLVRQAADDAREAARAQGYALGWAEGQRAAQEQAAVELEARRLADLQRQQAQAAALDSVVSALRAAVGAVNEAEAAAWPAVADELTAASVRIVESLLARELAATGDALLESVRTALRALGPGPVVVRLNPADLALLTGSGATPDDVTFAADPSVVPGTAQARVDDTQVLVDLPGVLAQVEAVLRG